MTVNEYYAGMQHQADALVDVWRTQTVDVTEPSVTVDLIGDDAVLTPVGERV